MPYLSPQQIAQYAYNAGFRGADLVKAVAIAIKESGGNPAAYNPETGAGTRKGSGSRGLWQIYGQAHPEFNNDSMYDPQANAIAAYKVYKEVGGKFTPWSTWNNGSASALAKTLNIGSVRNVAAAQSEATTQAVAKLAGTYKGEQNAAILANAVGSAGGTETITTPGVIDRVLIAARNTVLGKTAKGEQRETADLIAFLAGAALVLIGLIFLFVNSGPGQSAIQTVQTTAKTAVKAAAL